MACISRGHWLNLSPDLPNLANTRQFVGAGPPGIYGKWQLVVISQLQCYKFNN
jgi:hypothetical protein